MNRLARPPGRVDLHAGQFAGPLGLVVSHATGQVFVTRDAGESWMQAADLPDQFLEAVWLLDMRRALMAGDRGLQLSEDSGRTWYEVSGARGLNLYALSSPAEGVGFAGGFTAAGAPALLRSDDGGRTWRRLGAFPGRGPIAALLFDSLEEGVVASGRDLWRTQDGGATWALVASDLGKVRAIHRAPDQRWWAAGHDGLIAVSADGSSWQAMAGRPAQLLRDARFISERDGWVAGDQAPGAAPLWRTRDGGRSWTVDPAAKFDVHRLLPRGEQVVAIGKGGEIVELRR